MRAQNGLCAGKSVYARSEQNIRGETSLYALRTGYARGSQVIRVGTGYARSEHLIRDQNKL